MFNAANWAACALSWPMIQLVETKHVCSVRSVAHIWSCTSIDSKYILKPPLIDELLDHPIPKAAAHHHSNCSSDLVLTDLKKQWHHTPKQEWFLPAQLSSQHQWPCSSAGISSEPAWTRGSPDKEIKIFSITPGGRSVGLSLSSKEHIKSRAHSASSSDF